MEHDSAVADANSVNTEGAANNDKPPGEWRIVVEVGDEGQNVELTNKNCDVQTGQCSCKTNVVGRICNLCAAQSYGFSAQGCKVSNQQKSVQKPNVSLFLTASRIFKMRHVIISVLQL